MNAILKLIPLEKIIVFIALKLRGITIEQWRYALQLIVILGEKKLENSQRWKWAKEDLAEFGMDDSAARNWLIETALSYIQKGLHK